MADSQINTGTQPADVASSLWHGNSFDNAAYQKGEQKLLSDTEKVRKDEASVPLTKPPNITPAPDQKDYATNPMESFGSFAMVLATLGSAMTKRPLTNALNAGAEVMKAKNESNATAYKAAMDKWKIDSENSWKMADWEQKNFQDMREKYKDDMDGLNREAEIWAAMTKNPALDAAAKSGEVLQYMDNHQKALREGQKSTEAINQTHDNYNDMVEKYKKENNTDVVPLEKQHEFSRRASAEQVQIGKGNLASSAEHFDITKADLDDIYPGTGLTVRDVISSGQQYLHDKSVIARGGLSKADKEAIKNEASRQAALLGLSGADVVAMQAGTQADVSSLIKLQAQADASQSFERNALKQFDLAMSLAPKGTSEDVWPFINKWVQGGETALGNPDTPAYVEALLTGANEYAKITEGATGAAGSSVQSREMAKSIFPPSFTTDQIGNVVAVAKKGMANRVESYKDQLGDIKSRISGKPSKEPAAGGSAAGGSAAPKAGQVVRWDDWK